MIAISLLAIAGVPLVLLAIATIFPPSKSW
jgi:hypothetical protein